ncbi:hypothetical protein HFO77_29575 [Rhizobium leguminosarum]|uniref:GFA family protein n=1 Tax=Rhizobium leguminosarum TaxID=384 RepID=UPI001C939A9D|nr:hypothetical protein [Rhizobium leguminosarum]
MVITGIGPSYHNPVQPPQDAHVTSGEVCSFTKTADSGNELTRHFCPNCCSAVLAAIHR